MVILLQQRFAAQIFLQTAMILSTLHSLLRPYRRRTFTDRALEREFLAMFRSAGVKFMAIGTSTGALAYLAFFTIDLFGGNKSLFASPQPLRLAIAVLLGIVTIVTRFKKQFALEHYSIIWSTIVATTVLAAFFIGFKSRVGEPTPILYWSLSSSALLITVAIYGFSRLKTTVTIALSVFTALAALFFAIQAPVDIRLLNRMIVHLTAINIICFTLHRVVLYRERKLFMQSKRRQNVAELRRAKDRAEKADRAKSAFLANMSHEIRTPMNGVLGTLSLLDETQLSGKNRELINIAKHSASSLLQVINEILDFAKIDADHLNLRCVPFNPVQMLGNASEVFQANAAAKNIRLITQIDTSAALLAKPLLGDEEKLRRVLLNLISNAVKFTHVGTVEVCLAATLVDTGYELIISVKDSGIGIAPDKITQLFQPFYQVESGTTRSYGGSGLGLAICKRIIETMNGKISVSSAPGVGTTFNVMVTLPVADHYTMPSDTKELVADQEESGAAHMLAGHVLLVEDNPVNAFISGAMLQSLGLTSTHAENGHDAVELFKNGHFDLVMMDCEMPVMDGYHATKEMRLIEAGEMRDHTPIIAVTAHALTGDRELCLGEGMDDYLSKPLDRELMLVSLAKWLRQQRNIPPTTSATRPLSSSPADGYQVPGAPQVAAKDALA